MKQDQLNQHIKHALESIDPEVPAHLWNNIQAGISGGASANGKAENAQSSGSTSGSTGAAAALKIGSAAVVILSGGLLAWHLMTDTPKEPEHLAEKVQQVVPKTDKAALAKQPENTDEIQVPVESPEDYSAKTENGLTAHSSIDEPVGGDELITYEVDEAIDQQETGFNAKDDTKEEVSEVPSVKDENEILRNESQPVQDKVVSPEKTTEREQEDLQADESQTNPQILEFDVPLEAGILASKVSGEAPLTVNFSNVAGAKSYEWDFDNGRWSAEAEPTMTFTEPGDYVVRLVVRDARGNRVNDQMEITVFEVSKIFVPDVITPNGDGVNDEFKVIGHNTLNVRFSVYRLDGSLVFENHGNGDAWDGMDAQSPQADKYIVEAVAQKMNGEPIQKRQVLHVLRD